MLGFGICWGKKSKENSDLTLNKNYTGGKEWRLKQKVFANIVEKNIRKVECYVTCQHAAKERFD